MKNLQGGTKPTPPVDDDNSDVGKKPDKENSENNNSDSKIPDNNGNQPSENNTPKDDSVSKVSLPKTSDIAIRLFVTIMIISFVGIIFIIHKKNK